VSDKTEKVLVEVIQGSSLDVGGCNCSCCAAVDSCGSASPDAEDIFAEVEKLTGELKELFGERVEIKYVDADKEGIDNYPILDRVLRMGYPYPITLFNGEPKFAGGIMTGEIKDTLEELLA
jgi:hypothetical protein